MDYYWEIVQFDDTKVDIPPQAVETVKRRLDNKEPINLKTMSIPANQVKAFRQTGKRYSEQPLIEDVARAFNEPLLTEDGSVVAKWVKKPITAHDRAKAYNNPAYKTLTSDGNMVMVAFRLPAHLIDPRELTECTEDEIRQLNKH